MLHENKLSKIVSKKIQKLNYLGNYNVKKDIDIISKIKFTEFLPYFHIILK